MPVNRLASIRFAVAGALFAATLSPALAEQPRATVPANPDERTIAHTLNRIGFGARPGDIERVRRIGLPSYLEQQLHPDRITDTAMTERLATYPTLTMSTRELAERFYIPALMEQRQQQQTDPPAPADPAASPDRSRGNAQRAQRQVFADLSDQKLLRAMYSERQLEEVMVDFWFNHFNVFGGKGATRLYLTEYERDAIRPNALGRFRDLLHATAKSPAMLFYLDNWQNSAPPTATTSAPLIPDRGNMRRPGMQGPGKPGRPGMQRPQQRTMTPPNPQNRRPRGINENYARELMELHTVGVDGGYTQQDVQEVARAFTGWTIANPRMGGEFRFDPRMHDDGEKVIMGRRIKSGGGMKDGEDVLDILARHPLTARFIATKLARRFVTDEPPAALVSRAAARFTETDGDIREVVRTIITSPEFFSASAYRAKVKTPFEFVASAVRASGAQLRTAVPVAQALRELGMPLYMCQPPTGYADVAQAWVNTGALLNRMNFALTLATGRNTERRERAASAPVNVSADTVIQQVLAGDLSDATRSTIAEATEPTQAIALVLGSPEFQKR